ncbi:MAG: PAS domain S-box protein [Trueperaceae bacterium]
MANERVLWLTPQGERAGETPNDPLPNVDLRIDFCSPERAEECIRKQSEGEGAPEVVVIGSDTPSQLRLARQVYRKTPLSQIIFLVEKPHLAQFRLAMSLAPMIGTYWSIVEPNPEAISEALSAAAKTSRQRRQLRTSLDAINLRLSSERPPRDSSEYRKLVISDKYLAAILEHAQDAIVSLDPSGRIASWNTGAVELFGRSSEAAGNLRVEELVSPGERESMRVWLARALRGSPVVQREVECLEDGGETFFAEVTLAPVRDESGEVIAVSLTARDVSERKRNEEELRRIQKELEDRVAERTEALSSVNKELEAFTYSASHDLRAPLRGIDGFSQALLEDYGRDLDEAATHYVNRIRTGAQRMGEIIDALLMLSHISLAELHLSPVDLGQMAQEIVDELRELEPERNVEFNVHPGVIMHVDEKLMRIALQNVLSNAWKFTRQREPAIIEFGRLEGSENSTFFVRDNGAGFDMKYVDKLFSPFQRIHHPSRFEGSGIGLGTVQRVISRHKGRVWGQGVPDAGATFYFHLPGPELSRKTSDAPKAS